MKKRSAVVRHKSVRLKSGRNAGDHSGYRAWFRHKDGEEYSVLLKGYTTVVLAAAACEVEEKKHSVVCFKLELWNREDDTP